MQNTWRHTDFYRRNPAIIFINNGKNKVICDIKQICISSTPPGSWVWYNSPKQCIWKKHQLNGISICIGCRRVTDFKDMCLPTDTQSICHEPEYTILETMSHVIQDTLSSWNIRDSRKAAFRLLCLQKHQTILKLALAFLLFYTEFEVSALAMHWKPLGLNHRSLLPHHPTAL